MHTRNLISGTHLSKRLVFGLLACVLVVSGCEEQPAADAPPAAASQTHAPESPESPPPPEPPAETSTPHDESEHTAQLQIVDVQAIKDLIAETAERDQILVIDFWATWCVPCVEMFPSLHEGLVARGDAVRAVTVTLDDPSREPAAIEFLTEQDALHDAYIFKSDSAEQQALADQIGKQWDNLNVPAILVYDATGELVGEFMEGGSTDAILAKVDSLLTDK